MKKLISLLMALVMVLSLAACTGNSDENTDAENNEAENTVTDDTTDTEGENEIVDDTTDNTDAETTNTTLGETMLMDFQGTIAANPEMTAQEIADDLMTNPAILFAPATMPVEEGFLNGFTNEITGFEEAVMFAPMIGSIPFVGYIFTLGEDADVDAFIDNLEANADLRWNICVEAEEMVVDHVANTVFFLMCPATLDAE